MIIENGISQCLYSEYIDLNIYSRYYFQEVLEKIEFDYDYTLFYADFRELGHANHVLGVSKTDELIGEALKTTIKKLPKGISVRIAGDEFLFVVPTNSLEKEPSNYINEINNKLKTINYNGISPYMDFSTVNEKQGVLIGNAFENANEIMDEIKMSRKISTQFDDSNNIKLRNAMRVLLNTFRVDQIQDENNFIETSKIFNNSIKDVYHNFPNYIDKSEYYKSHINPIKEKDIYTGKQYLDLHNAIENGDIEFFNNNQDFIKYMEEKLSINGVTGYYNKLYYNNQFCEEHKDEEYYGRYFEIEGLKVANTLFGHDNTDQLLKKLYEVINRNLNKDNIYCFDFLSAKSLILSKNYEDIDNDKINACIDYINSNVFEDLKLHLYTNIVDEKATPYDMYNIVQLFGITSGEAKDNTRKEILSNNGGKMVIASILKDEINYLKENYTEEEAISILQTEYYNEVIKIDQKIMERNRVVENETPKSY